MLSEKISMSHIERYDIVHQGSLSDIEVVNGKRLGIIVRNVSGTGMIG